MATHPPGRPNKLLFLDVDGVLHELRIAFRDGKVCGQRGRTPATIGASGGVPGASSACGCSNSRASACTVACAAHWQAMDEHCFLPACMAELKRVVQATGVVVARGPALVRVRMGKCAGPGATRAHPTRRRGRDRAQLKLASI